MPIVSLEALCRRLQVTASNILPAFNLRMQDSPPDICCRYGAGRLQGQTFLVESDAMVSKARRRLVLSAGDSPCIGYRIPVDALPWVAPDDLEYPMDAAPFADRATLPVPARRMELFTEEAGCRSTARCACRSPPMLRF